MARLLSGRTIVLGAILAAALAGCAATPPVGRNMRGTVDGAAPILSTPTSVLPASRTTTVPPARSTAMAAVSSRDCGWSKVLYAGLDRNEDGIRDGDELPLAGVTITARYAGADWAFGSGATDPSGQIVLASGLFSCDTPAPEIIVAAVPPAGYRLTTPDTLSSQSTAGWAYHFGFAPINP